MIMFSAAVSEHSPTQQYNGVSFTSYQISLAFEFATATLDTPFIRLQKAIGDYLRMYDTSVDM
jgi:hypothetical protein